MPPRLLRLLAAALAAGALAPVAAAQAGTVPINPFGRPGDVHLDFPTFTAPARSGGFEPSRPEGLVRPVGDVDGDGRTDLAMAISSPEPSWTTTTWVSFSPATTPSTARVDEPGWRGLRIVGAGTTITGVAGVGDVNEDGLGDVAVTGDGAGAWVVFGGRETETVDVRQLGSRGFAITGVSACSSGGGGNGYTGVFTRSSSVHAVGDQDGDGRPDLAICTPDGVHVVHTPERPAGAVVDVRQDDGGRTSTIATGDVGVQGLRLDTAGDTDGDGRADLVISWERDGRAHVLGVPAPAPGVRTTLAAAETSPRAFALTAGGVYVERLAVVGDHDGDGRRDLALALVGREEGRVVMVAYTPAPGTRREVLPLAPGDGQRLPDRGSGITDVGDQDGDGRPDLAFDESVRLSSTGEFVSIDQQLPECVYLRRWESGGLVLCALEHKIATTLPDTNGDGKPELVAIHTDPLPIEDGVVRGTWRLDVFPSAVVPVPQEVDAPVALPGGAVDFSGSFVTAPNGPLRTLAARAAVHVTDAAGRTATARGVLVDAGAAGTTRAAVRADARTLGLVPGGTYAFRLALENGRGLTGTSAPASFVYRPPAEPVAPGGGPKAPVAGPGAAPARGRTLRGTRRADRLRGTSLGDVLRGLGGADVLLGLAGDDRLEGGTGDDRLDGGSGQDHLTGGPGRDRLHGRAGRDRLLAADGTRDLVDCGPGRDSAVVDRIDRVRGCERVTRRLQQRRDR